MLDTVCLLRRMMRFRPLSAEVERLNQLVDFLAGYLAGEGVFTEIRELAGRRILYAATTATPVCEFLANAHLDVVPGTDEQFELVERDGWLHGRGTYDCLGNCAMLANLLVEKRGSQALGVIFSTDEEIGGQTTALMAGCGYGARRLLLVVDGSGYAITVAQKGVLVVRLTAVGKACHAAYPWLGDNPIDRLVDGYVRLRQLFAPVQPPDEWRDTLAATLVGAGNADNRVPEVATMTVNIRFTDGADPDHLLDQLRRSSQLTVEVVSRAPVVACEATAPAIQQLLQAMRASLGREIAIERSNGATDARHFVDLGVPMAIIGIPGRGLHAEDEAVELAGLHAYQRLLGAYLGRFV